MAVFIKQFFLKNLCNQPSNRFYIGTEKNLRIHTKSLCLENETMGNRSERVRKD
jgi:hypothetical protein